MVESVKLWIKGRCNFVAIGLLAVSFLYLAITFIFYKPYTSRVKRFKQLTFLEFQKQIATNGYSVIFFGSDSCPYCHEFVKKIPEGYNNLYYLDIGFILEKNDRNKLTELYSIDCIPLLVKYSESLEIDRLDSSCTDREITDLLCAQD